MRKLVLILLSVALCLLSGAALTSAQSDWWEGAWATTCPAPNGNYSKGGVYPRYEYRNRRIVLVDILTGQVTKELETSLVSSQVDYFEWSPDCHYLVGTLASSTGGKTVVWDVVASLRVAEFSGSYYVGVFWNPNSRYIVADTSSGAYLFDTVTSKSLLLSPPVDRSAYSNYHPFDFVRWDNLRNQVIAAQVNGDVVAYDINTGGVAGYFHEGYLYGHPDFRLSPDNTKIAVFSNQGAVYFSVWDRDTLAETELRLPTYTFIYIYSWEQLAISPDNRYVAVGARDSLCVWDLQNLPAERSERFPKLYAYSQFSGSLNFVGDEILEVVGDKGQTQRWNVRTGEVVSS